MPIVSSVKDLRRRLNHRGAPDVDSIIDAYYEVYKLLQDNPDLSDEQISKSLVEKGFAPAISGAATKFVKPDLGIPLEGFVDAEAMKNYAENLGIPTKIRDGESDAQFFGRIQSEINEQHAQHKAELPIRDRLKAEKEAAEKAKAAAAKSPRKFGTGLEQHLYPSASEETHGPKWQQDAAREAIETIRHNEHTPFPGEKVAGLAPEETEAHAYRKGLDPRSTENKRILNEIQSQHRKGIGSKATTEASNRFLGNINKSPHETYREMFGDAETEHENTLREDALRDWQERIAPNIKQSYLSHPGVKHHGFIEKRMKESAEKYGRGITSEIAKQRIANKGVGYQSAASQKNAELSAAGLAGDAAKSDTDRNAAAAETLHRSHVADQASQGEHANAIQGQGAQKRALQQSLINEEKNAHKEAADFEVNKAKVVADMAAKQPLSQTTVKNAAAPEPHESSLYPKISDFGIGAATAAFNKEKTHKSGGRVKRADGGPINLNDAIQSAVMYKTTPSSEILRSDRGNAYIALLQAKQNHRKRLATGGAVNPIQQGAEEAADVALKHKIQQQRLKAFEEEPEHEDPQWLSMLNAGMAGMARGDDTDHGLGRVGKVWTGAHNDIKEARSTRKKTQAEKRKELEDIAHNYAKEDNDKQTLGIHQLAHGLKEREFEHGKTLTAAQIKHLNAQTTLDEAKAGKLGKGYGENGEDLDSFPTQVLSKDQEKVLNEAGDTASAAYELASIANQGKSASKKIKTGYGGEAANKFGSIAAGLYLESEPQDVADWSSVNKDFITKYRNLHGHLNEKDAGKLAQAFKILEESKPMLSLSQKVNRDKYVSAEMESLRVLNSRKDIMKRNHASPKALREIDEKINQVVKWIGDDILSHAQPDTTPSHNDTYATDAANSDDGLEAEMIRRFGKGAVK